MTYQMTIEEHPTYLHARATGEHSPENVLRFLEDAYAECVKRERRDVLVEVAFTGPSLDITSIFGVISQRVGDATKLGKIAYLDVSRRDPSRKEFAANVAQNRGVNVRLFWEIEAARRWMTEG